MASATSGWISLFKNLESKEIKKLQVKSFYIPPALIKMENRKNNKLEARGVRAAGLHGDLGKLARSMILKKFKNGQVRVLVTKALSTWGLDAAECDLVVNLELPVDSVHYAHRAGRTGRLGRKRNVVTICEQREVFVVQQLQRQLGHGIKACEFVEGKLVVCEGEKTEGDASEAEVE